MCKLFELCHDSLQLEQRSRVLLIEPEAQRVHQDHPQQTVAQMPQIACPHPLEVATIRQLPKNGVDAIAHPTQDRALGRFGLGELARRKGASRTTPFARTLAGYEAANSGDLPKPGHRSFQSTREQFRSPGRSPEPKTGEE